VNKSPHHYGNIQLSSTRHDQGRNWRALTFNRECWQRMMGFPLDDWNSDNINNVITPFGRVLLWENNRSHLYRPMVRA
jgi:hypothetical protein